MLAKQGNTPVSETRVQSDGKNSFNLNTKNQHANVKTNQSKHKDSNSSRGACVSENSTKSKGNNIDSSVIIDLYSHISCFHCKVLPMKMCKKQCLDISLLLR